jgi:hypothetical protein
LGATLGRATVYCWMFQNTTQDIAEELDLALSRRRSYLGAMKLDFSYPLHLQFFRNRLVEKYRIEGRVWHEFRSMGDAEEGPDVAESEILSKFDCTLQIEDIGARRTIFDNFDQREHFVRVKDFEDFFDRVEGWSRDDSSQLVFDLEEIHPALFDALAASVRTLSRAETSEDIAQVALSGRRFLERFADALFAPRKKPLDGRKLGKAEYKNRLWAYIKSALNPSEPFSDASLQDLGNEVDRIINAFNKGLHDKLGRDELLATYISLARLVLSIVALNPRKARRPYAAYSSEMLRFFDDVVRDHNTGDKNDL